MFRRPNALMITGLILALLGAAPGALAEDLPELPAADDPIEVEALARAARVLTGLPGCDEEELAAAAADLASGGTDMVPCLLVLRHRFTRPEHVAATVGALERLRAGKIESYVHFQLGTSHDPAVRSLAYELLTRHGTPRSLPALLAAMQNDTREVERAGRAALAALLGRPDALPAYSWLEREWKNLPADIRGRVLTAVADADTPRGAGLLGALLGRDPSLDPVVLAGLARMDAHGSDLGVTEAVLKATASSRPMVRKLATAALGRLEDPGAVPRLLELLESGEEAIRKNAYWALRSISGQGFPPNADRWRAWYGREMDWWWTKGQRLLEDLRSKDDRIAVRAILLLARRPFFRRAVEGELAGLRETGSETTKAVASHSMRRLGLDSDPAGDLERAAATARFLDPSARPDVVVGRRPAPPIHIGPATGLPLTLPILALLVVLYLVWRVFGRSLVSRTGAMKGWISDPGGRKGPLTITVERRPRA